MTIQKKYTKCLLVSFHDAIMKSYFNSQALIFPLTLYVEIELLQNSLFKFYSASTFPLTFDIFGCNCHGNWVPARYVYRWPHICSGSIETSTISRSLKVQLRACISGVTGWSYKLIRNTSY